VAIFIDATIVRTIIVPAAMELLGDWNWYLPRWLEWLPNVSVEGHVDDVPADDTPANAPELGPEDGTDAGQARRGGSEGPARRPHLAPNPAPGTMLATNPD
jgi:hypothetical protein